MMAELLNTTTPLLCLPERFEDDCAATEQAYTVTTPAAGRAVVSVSAVSGNIPQREECVHVRVARTPHPVDVCSTFSGLSPAAVEIPVDVAAGPFEITVEHLAAREFPPLPGGLCPWDDARPWLYWPPYPGAPACTPGSLRVNVSVAFEAAPTTTQKPASTTLVAPPSSTTAPPSNTTTPAGPTTTVLHPTLPATGPSSATPIAGVGLVMAAIGMTLVIWARRARVHLERRDREAFLAEQRRAVR